MNILNNHITGQNFQARIKLSPSNKELLKNAVAGATAMTAGVASVTSGIDSAMLGSVEHPTIYSSIATPETVLSAKECLSSYEGAGIPVQSTIIPLGLSGYGLHNIDKGGKYWDKKITDNKVIPD